ncbi:MAG: hypothetical protein AAGD07_22925 [Planctomycetota bacterium]
MTTIRPFRNVDLPTLLDVWLQHWQSSGQSPPVSVAVLERAILSRLFFEPQDLLVAENDGAIVAWCHHQLPLVPDSDATAIVPAICLADEGGVAACDDLLAACEAIMIERGAKRIVVGSVRDLHNGYTGLPPIGHGVGVPVSDARVASLMSRHGYQVTMSNDRMQVSTPTYRPPVSRDLMQFRRTTRVDCTLVVPHDHRVATAMAHIDIQRFDLVDHLQRTCLATVDLWRSDPESQVMEGSLGILSFDLLSDVEATETAPMAPVPPVAPVQDGLLTPEAKFLVASIVQTLSNQRVFTVETSVNETEVGLLGQLRELKFERIDRGHLWSKEVT